MTAERPFNITKHPLEHYWSDRKRALADLGYYLGKTYIDDPVTPRSCWLRSDGAGSSVPVTEGEQALIDLFLAAEGLDAHPGEHHEFRTTCKRCGEDGTLVISLITYDQQVRIEERAASQPVAEEADADIWTRPAVQPGDVALAILLHEECCEDEACAGWEQVSSFGKDGWLDVARKALALTQKGIEWSGAFYCGEHGRFCQRATGPHRVAASQPVAEEGERPARRPRAHHVRPPGAEIGARPTWEDPS